MTYLEMVQEVHAMLGTQGTISSLTSITGYPSVLAKAVKHAWLDIQNSRKEWVFNRAAVDISVTTASTNYTMFNIFSDSTFEIQEWKFDRILYDYQPLDRYDYDYYITLNPSNMGSTKPHFYAVDPVNDSLYFNPVDAAYTITAHYYQTPQELSANGDTPRMPSRFHWVIVYEAVKIASNFLGNPELYREYELRHIKALGELHRSQLPQKKLRLSPMVS